MIYYLSGIDCSLGLSVMTPPCHGGKRSSTLLGSAKIVLLEKLFPYSPIVLIFLII